MNFFNEFLLWHMASRSRVRPATGSVVEVRDAPVAVRVERPTAAAPTFVPASDPVVR